MAGSGHEPAEPGDGGADAARPHDGAVAHDTEGTAWSALPIPGTERPGALLRCFRVNRRTAQRSLGAVTGTVLIGFGPDLALSERCGRTAAPCPPAAPNGARSLVPPPIRPASRSTSGRRPPRSAVPPGPEVTRRIAERHPAGPGRGTHFESML